MSTFVYRKVKLDKTEQEEGYYTL